MSCTVSSDSNRNEQVETNIGRVNFDSNFANVTLFRLRKILLFCIDFSWLGAMCILTKACSFASWQILT